MNHPYHHGFGGGYVGMGYQQQPPNMGFEISNNTNSTDHNSKISRIFVGNLNPREVTDRMQLYHRFVKYGNITAISLHKGFAFIQFTSKAEADHAVAEENGLNFGSQKMDICISTERNKAGGGGGGGGAKRYEGDFNQHAQAKKRRYQDNFGGNVYPNKVGMNHPYHGSGGGYVGLGYQQQPPNMGFEISNNTNSTDHNSKISRLFVGNLNPREVTDRMQLYHRFIKYGNITAISLHKGFAFIQFTSKAEADHAVAEENGLIFGSQKMDLCISTERNKGAAGGGAYKRDSDFDHHGPQSAQAKKRRFQDNTLLAAGGEQEGVDA